MFFDKFVNKSPQMRQYTIISLLLLLLPILAEAGNYDIEKLTNDQGLSNSSINTIFQDSSNLMWFGTWDGLNRYNGSEFRVYKPLQHDDSSISNHIIRNVIEDNEGTLWIATDRGINRYYPDTDSFDHFFTDMEYSRVVSESSFHIFSADKEHIFAYINEKGLFSFDKDTQAFVSIPGFNDILIDKIFYESANSFWILTKEAHLLNLSLTSSGCTLSRDNYFDSINIVSASCNNNILWVQDDFGHYISYDLTERTALSHHSLPKSFSRINAVSFQDDRQIIGTATGLYSFTPQNGHFEKILNGVPVMSVFIGSQQLIWIGTDMQGVWKLSLGDEYFNTYPQEGPEIFDNCAARSFYEDSNGNLWVGTKGRGIFIFSGSEKDRQVQRSITSANGLTDNSVYVMKEGEKYVWIGTDGKGLNYVNKKDGELGVLNIPDKYSSDLNITSVYSLYQQSSDILWVGTSGYGLYKLFLSDTAGKPSISSYEHYTFNPEKNSLSNNVVYSIIPKDNSHLWVGTRGGGVDLFDIDSKTFRNFKFSKNDVRLLSADDILSLMQDTNGYLWVGTSLGLYRLTLKENGESSYIHYSEQEGLPNNTIHGILQDSMQNIWVSTNHGLAKLVDTSNNLRIISYYKTDGLQDNEFSDGAFYLGDKSGEMFFGGIRGFNAFQPTLVQNSSYIPNLVMEDFYIDNEKVSIATYLKNIKGNNTLVLTHKNKSFSFRFFPVDHIAADKCEISYMLEGFDKGWVNIGTSNAIVFSNLPPKEYTLNVRSSTSDKIWSEDYFKLKIKVYPPWYASHLAYWLYLVISILFGCLIVKVVRYQYDIKQKMKFDKMEKQKMSEIHEAKLQFFTNIAHEFSNSLTLIYGPCEELMKDTHLSHKSKKYLNVIKSNSERMQSLIQQLILFRKAETGHLSLKITNVDIVELVKFEADYFNESIAQKHVNFRIHHPEKLFWPTDRDSIEKIVFNLISNALKHTPDNENVDIFIESTSERLKFKITNTGVGISKDKQESIFNRFEVLNKFEKDISRGKTSNGIGLAMCKSLAKLLKGDIGIQSDEKTYTSFYVTLPYQEPEEKSDDTKEAIRHDIPEGTVIKEQDDNLVPEAEHEQTGNRGFVLLVDDDPEIRRFIKDILKSNFKIKEAHNGQVALDMIKQKTPDLIISDVMMPVMGGVEFIKKVKSNELTRHIPIILLSAKNSVENQIEGIENGADAYLGKPFHPRYLTAVIDSLIGRGEVIMDYSKSALSAVDQFKGNVVKKEDMETITKITEIIYENISNEALSIDQIANEMNISKMKLYRKIKDIVDMTPTEYIRSIRLDKAECLLKTTNKTVQEIMFECGFNSKTYFYREFSKKFNLTPKEYRTKHQH